VPVRRNNQGKTWSRLSRRWRNDGVKASLAGDISFLQKTYADDWTGGFSGGIWTTKDSLLTDSKDATNSKMNTLQISDLKVRVYGDSTAIATYTNTYDVLPHFGNTSAYPTQPAVDRFRYKLTSIRYPAGTGSSAIRPSFTSRPPVFTIRGVRARARFSSTRYHRGGTLKRNTIRTQAVSD
jgi:hypothetical protein